jgi:hypothetical protein
MRWHTGRLVFWRHDRRTAGRLREPLSTYLITRGSRARSNAHVTSGMTTGFLAEWDGISRIGISIMPNLSFMGPAWYASRSASCPALARDQ